ncbi:PBECR4 domain-containing protein [[Ruminococcus] lactaris]|jgi:hypothetical protein|uniref:PBECR4 domain-containing protein n=1 Tax=[Ruminococcus] lactaris TaxID=46228 RepID=UPI001D052991|nr:PBECR4 domain-containing protein [[Ruminococcus] lactaris]MCB5554299.1 PBECR4 domain-containing protein [[Ruminococcus] lactaris]MCB5739160.1 PBECR4 domain-containing protein [[Ruminococcus] lactaris]MCB5832314.1 PBECR4 domain-containing protein [[Ruminococcus] lactaris]MCB5847257.1 PBECR4 domain-containing protein [[Ruminococcus] lactaris]
MYKGLPLRHHFLHLTGVETRLSAKDFYNNAKKSILTKISSILTQDMYMQMPKGNFRV